MRITAEWESIEEMNEFARKIVCAAGTENRTETAVPKQEPKAVLVPLVEVPVPEPKEEPAQVIMPAPEPAPAAKRTVTRQEIQGKAIALMDAGKQDQLQALLTKYGVPALPSIPEDQLAAFMADLEAV